LLLVSYAIIDFLWSKASNKVLRSVLYRCICYDKYVISFPFKQIAGTNHSYSAIEVWDSFNREYLIIYLYQQHCEAYNLLSDL
jgi:hypothetical protein